RRALARLPAQHDPPILLDLHHVHRERPREVAELPLDRGAGLQPRTRTGRGEVARQFRRIRHRLEHFVYRLRDASGHLELELHDLPPGSDLSLVRVRNLYYSFTTCQPANRMTP